MFEDLYLHEPCVAFLKAKSDAFESYKLYEAWVKVHCNPSGIACLQKARTIRHLNVHDSPQSNGVVECLNQTLVESAWSMLFEANMSPFLWAEAIHHAIWLHAWIPSRALPDCIQ